MQWSNGNIVEPFQYLKQWFLSPVVVIKVLLNYEYEGDWNWEQRFYNLLYLHYDNAEFW